MTQSTMKKMSGAMLLSGVALAALGVPGMAAAQTAPAAEESADSGDIIVTARKRSEDIQTVPISITALTSEDLAQRNISNLNDLSNATPGVAITSIAGGNVQNIYLRGLAPANTNPDINVDANVGTFIDGIYQTSRNTLDMISVLDVGQIEVAKGPQSALFGRSTFAGVLAITTKRPSHELEGRVEATAGIDKDYRIRGTVSAPLAEGLYLRVGGGYLTYDGYGDNSADPGDKLGGTEKYAVSASLEYAPTDELTARLSGFLTHSKSEITPEYVFAVNGLNCGTTGAVGPTLYCGTLPARKISAITPNAPDTVAKTRQVSFELNWRRDGVLATSTTGYSQADNFGINEYDGGSAGQLFGVCTVGNSANAACGATNFGLAPYTRLVRSNSFVAVRERVRTFSQEIRLQSDNNAPFSWLLGGSYFNSQIPLYANGLAFDASGLAANERFVQVSQVTPPAATGTGAYDFTANPFTVPSILTSQVFGSYTVASTKTFGIFGALGYRFGNLRINAEGRYNMDRKRAQTFGVVANNGAASQPFVNQPISGTSTPAAGVFPFANTAYARSFDTFTPRFSVDFQATPDIFLYATAAKGVRSGGFNTAAGILPSEVAYDSESNWTYEGGFKSKLFNRLLLLNASYFHTDWSNAQVNAFTLSTAATSATTRIVRNAGDIKVDGFEVQADLKGDSIFGVGGSVVYSNPRFQKGAYDGSQTGQCRIGGNVATATSAPGCPPLIAVQGANGTTQYVPTIEGLRPPRSVKWQWNMHATVDAPLSDDWKLTGRFDVTYSGPVYGNLINTFTYGKRTLASARLGIEGKMFGVSVWGNNLFDRTYVVNSQSQPRAANPLGYNIPEVYLGEGRRYGITATAKF